MSALLDTLASELGKAVPMIVAALVGAALAWINALRDRARVREVMAESATRQALDAHGDSPEADLAAVAELRKIDPRYAPKDAPRAVSQAMERERARASVRPAAEPTPRDTMPDTLPQVAPTDPGEER